MMQENLPIEIIAVEVPDGTRWCLWYFPNADIVEEYINEIHIKTLYPNGEMVRVKI